MKAMIITKIYIVESIKYIYNEFTLDNFKKELYIK